LNPSNLKPEDLVNAQKIQAIYFIGENVGILQTDSSGTIYSYGGLSVPNFKTTDGTKTYLMLGVNVKHGNMSFKKVGLVDIGSQAFRLVLSTLNSFTFEWGKGLEEVDGSSGSGLSDFPDFQTYLTDLQSRVGKDVCLYLDPAQSALPPFLSSLQTSVSFGDPSITLSTAEAIAQEPGRPLEVAIV
jgi:hypothetical protein